jgi:hypothetical protein
MPYSHLSHTWPTLPEKRGKIVKLDMFARKTCVGCYKTLMLSIIFTFSCSHSLHSHIIKWTKLVLLYPLEFPFLCTAGWTRNPGKWGVCSVIGSYRSRRTLCHLSGLLHHHSRTHHFSHHYPALLHQSNSSVSMCWRDVEALGCDANSSSDSESSKPLRKVWRRFPVNQVLMT